MSVQVQGQRRHFVAQHLLHDLDVRARTDRQRCRSVVLGHAEQHRQGATAALRARRCATTRSAAPWTAVTAARQARRQRDGCPWPHFGSDRVFWHPLWRRGGTRTLRLWPLFHSPGQCCVWSPNGSPAPDTATSSRRAARWKGCLSCVAGGAYVRAVEPPSLAELSAEMAAGVPKLQHEGIWVYRSHDEDERQFCAERAQREAEEAAESQRRVDDLLRRTSPHLIRNETSPPAEVTDSSATPPIGDETEPHSTAHPESEPPAPRPD